MSKHHADVTQTDTLGDSVSSHCLYAVMVAHCIGIAYDKRR